MLTHHSHSFSFISTEAGLTALAAELALEKRIAVDLEADSLYHYQEKICLIQISSPSHNFIIDPLSLSNIGELAPIFADAAVQKIFHSADNDLRSLYRDYDIVTNGLFDTQLAGRFSGRRSTGLETVLKDEFGIILNKKYQKKDWSQRPLPEAMLVYAAQDTAHLIALADVTTQALTALGRLGWLEEECVLLTAVRPAEPDHQPLFLRFKGAHQLPPRHLAVLEQLLQARDNLARSKDKPHFKLIGNEALYQIARRPPADLEQLQALRALSPQQFKRYGEILAAAVQTALHLPESRLPRYPGGKPPVVDPHVADGTAALKKWRALKARELDLDPGLLCNNALIQTLATQRPPSAEALGRIAGMKTWQRENFGHDIIRALWE